MLFLHISDIHFRKNEAGALDDPNGGLRSDIVEDVKRMRAVEFGGRPTDGIWLTGDIAFAGQPEEYQYAYEWLEEVLCPAAGCRIEDVFVIPGNHDVDRKKEAGPMQIMARQMLRGKPAGEVDEMIGKMMRDKLSSNLIFGPIDSYNRFAAKFLCSLRPYVDNDGTQDAPATPFAKRDLRLNDGSILRLWGFNTVLISDDTDALDTMLVDPAASQIPHEDGVCHVVMAHHPFPWLKNGQAFEARCNAMAKIQLFGHEHNRRIEPNRHYLRIRAGAMHPERNLPDWKPNYNWIELSVSKVEQLRKLNYRLWVRQYDVDKFVAMPDPEHNTIWCDSYNLPPWTPPQGPAKKVRSVDEILSVPVLETPTMPTSASQAPSVRSVATKMFKLKEHEQRKVISALDLDRPGDIELKDYELAVAAVKRSATHGVLAELDKLIDDALGGQR